MTIRNN